MEKFLILFCFMCLGPTYALAMDPLSHRAVYDLSLARASAGSGMEGLSGRMVVEFSDTCDSYTATQRLIWRSYYVTGTSETVDIHTTNWETRDGKQFRFASRTKSNGQIVLDVEGNAAVSDSGVIKAQYLRPQPKSIELPKDALFPTRHTLDGIERAKRGEVTYLATLFDGGGNDDEFYQTRGFLKLDNDRLPKSDAPELKDLESWAVRYSFFGTADIDQPGWTIDIRLYENAVTGDFLLDYGDYVVRGKMTQLQRLPATMCQ